MKELLIDEIFNKTMELLSQFIDTGKYPKIDSHEMQGLFISMSDTYIHFCLDIEDKFIESCMKMYEHCISSRESMLLYAKNKSHVGTITTTMFEKFLNGIDLFYEPETLQYFCEYYINEEAVKEDIGRIYGRTPNI